MPFISQITFPSQVIGTYLPGSAHHDAWLTKYCNAFLSCRWRHVFRSYIITHTPIDQSSFRHVGHRKMFCIRRCINRHPVLNINCISRETHSTTRFHRVATSMITIVIFLIFVHFDALLHTSWLWNACCSSWLVFKMEEQIWVQMIAFTLTSIS